MGLINLDDGEIIFNGKNFTKGDRKVKTKIRKEIGMLFQEGALFDSKTVENNIKFPLDMLTKMNEKEKIERVNFYLKKVGLENSNKKFPSELSGGMKKRVGIARAIVNNSKYLFCDEPNSGLDPKTSIKIDELIQEITYEYKMTTIIITHDMNSAKKIGDYINLMHEGKIIYDKKENILKSKFKILKEFIY